VLPSGAATHTDATGAFGGPATSTLVTLPAAAVAVHVVAPVPASIRRTTVPVGPGSATTITPETPSTANRPPAASRQRRTPALGGRGRGCRRQLHPTVLDVPDLRRRRQPRKSGGPRWRNSAHTARDYGDQQDHEQGGYSRMAHERNVGAAGYRRRVLSRWLRRGLRHPFELACRWLPLVPFRVTVTEPNYPPTCPESRETVPDCVAG